MAEAGMAIRTVIFDVDGTLVDSQAMFTSTMAAAFAAEGLAPPDPEVALRLVGISLPQLVAMLLPDAGATRQAAVTASYRRLYNAAATGAAEAMPYPGVEAGLRHLHGAGLVLGVATGKSRRGLDRLIAQQGWGGLFTTLQCADDHPSKPDRSMIDAALRQTGSATGMAVMVGDTTFDMEMARSAGIPALGVGWGYHPGADLTRAGATAVAVDFDAAVAWLEDWAG